MLENMDLKIYMNLYMKIRVIKNFKINLINYWSVNGEEKAKLATEPQQVLTQEERRADKDHFRRQEEACRYSYSQKGDA